MIRAAYWPYQSTRTVVAPNKVAAKMKELVLMAEASVEPVSMAEVRREIIPSNT